MRQLGDGERTNLIVKEFPKKLHIRLRAASVKYGKSIRQLTIEAVEGLLREKNRTKKQREAQNRTYKQNVGSNPTGPT